jgi:iron complex outermembrane receptor protein
MAAFRKGVGPCIPLLLLVATGSVRAGQPSDEVVPLGDTTAAREHIVVTGSRLDAGKSEGAQRVQVYTREKIDASGASTLNAFLNTLPDVSLSSTEGAGQSQSGQTSVRLHGLPTGTTLVLVNGRRVQDSAITLGTGFASNFFDLNYVPLSVVERIEVLPEGASAVYGSDAIAGVVNIILKREFTGAEASVMYSHASKLSEWDAGLGAGQRWERGGLTLFASFAHRDELTGFDRAVTAAPEHASDGGVDPRVPDCPTPNIFGINGTNLPGLNAPYAAVPTGFAGPPSIGEFSATAGTLHKCNVFSYNSFVPATDRAGAFAQGHFQLTPTTQLFGELFAARVREHFDYTPMLALGLTTFQRYTVAATNPYNPFGTTVGIGGMFTRRLSYQSDGDFVRPLVGVRGDLGDTWSWESTLGYARDRETYTSPNDILNNAAIQAAFNSTDPAIAPNPFVDRMIDSPAFDNAFFPYIQHYRASDAWFDAFARGTLLALPTGPLRAVAGLEYHRYQLHTDNGNFASFAYGPPGTPATYYRDSHAFFGEVRVPLLGATEGDAPVLEGTAAVRYDHFSDFGGTTNPQYGVVLHPFRGFVARANYGETFRAPPLFDLYSPVARVFPAFTMDPQRGNERVPITLVTGGNPSLKPETGTTRSFGFDYESPRRPGLEAGLTQWRIREDGNIQALNSQLLVNNPGAVPGSVVRDANGAIQTVTATLLNFGSIDVAGVSFHARYTFRSSYGTWSPAIAATNTHRYQVALTPGSPSIDAVSHAQDANAWAPRWKGTASLGWSMDRAALAGIARYVGAYSDYDSTRRIGDVWYFDLNARYTFADSALGAVRLELGAINLLDRQPQVSRYDFGIAGYDPAQADIRGRVLYARIATRF